MTIRVNIFIACFLFLAFTVSYASNKMESTKKDAKNFGKEASQEALKQIESIDITYFDENAENTFDGEEAKRQVTNNKFTNSSSDQFKVNDASKKKGNNATKSEVLEFLQSEEVQNNRDYIHQDDLLLNRAETISEENLNQIEDESKPYYTISTCQKPGEPYPISIIRTLDVDVIKDPAVIKETKVCLGHKKQKNFFWKMDAEEEVDKQQRTLTSDKTIANFSVEIIDGGLLTNYIVDIQWSHKPNEKKCDHFRQTKKTIKEEKVQEVDNWVYDNESLYDLLKSPNSTLIDRECLDDTASKEINGVLISRKCWREKIKFLYQYPESQHWYFLQNRGCQQIDSKCLVKGPLGCALWELTFKCYSKMVKNNQTTEEFDLFGSKENDIEYEANNSFSDVYTKIILFDEIKEEIANSKIEDISKVQIFAGKGKTCSKSIVDDLMYDCCFSYGGLAKELNLAHCTADEIALGEMRKLGLCHYIGSRNGKFLDLWTSREEHVFVCFPSKLARVFQEQARYQLKIDWGTPEKPNIRGLTSNEISKLDLTKMNLSEAFEQKTIAHFDEKLSSFEERLKAKIERMTKENV